GHEESSRSLVAIDRGLQRNDEFRSPLDFIDDQEPVRVLLTEASGIGSGKVTHFRIVERHYDASTLGHQLLCKGRFSYLAGALNRDNSRIIERFIHTWKEVSVSVLRPCHAITVRRCSPFHQVQ